MQLKRLGTSQFDLYLGCLSLEAIFEDIAAGLAQEGIGDKAVYRAWIAANAGYRTLLLRDGTGMTLRYLEQEQFIHIHPSRYAVHTVRVKANAMKTALMYLHVYGVGDGAAPDTDRINHVRRYLHLSPVSGKAGVDEIRKCMNLL